MILLFAFPFRSAGQVSDSLYLYNGQELIGTLKHIENGVITIDDRDMRILNVKAYKVRRLVASGTLFRIETTTSEVIYSTINASEKDGCVDLAGKEAFPLVQIQLLLPLKKNFFDRLNGNITAGFSYTKSSNIGQVNASGQVNYNTAKLENQLSFSAIYSIDSSRFSRDREDGNIFTAYNLSARWFLAAALTYQRNLELNIRQRFQELLGGGRKLLVRTDMVLLAVSGIALSQEVSTEGLKSKQLLELPLLLKFNFFKFKHPNLQLSSDQSAYFVINQNWRFIFSNNISLSWEIFHDFNFNLSPYSNYDSKPPDNSKARSDYGIVVSLSYKF